MDLDARTAVVTGAASGIGLALTEACLDAGMSVVMADVEAHTLSAEAARLSDLGGAVVDVVCNVGDPDSISALRDRALEAFGAVHLLCNNAGVAPGYSALRTSPAMWRWVTDVNLLGVAYGIEAFAPLLVAQGFGHVVNTASEAGLMATPTLAAYHATKYAVVGLSESLAMELDGTGVGVSCVCPELVDTKIFESTRNAPSELGLRPPREIPMSTIEAMMQSEAKAPSEVASAVLDAVRRDQFWVITHAITYDRVRHRHDSLMQSRRPTMYVRPAT